MVDCETCQYNSEDCDVTADDHMSQRDICTLLGSNPTKHPGTAEERAKETNAKIEQWRKDDQLIKEFFVKYKKDELYYPDKKDELIKTAIDHKLPLDHFISNWVHENTFNPIEFIEDIRIHGVCRALTGGPNLFSSYDREDNDDICNFQKHFPEWYKILDDLNNDMKKYLSSKGVPFF